MGIKREWQLIVVLLILIVLLVKAVEFFKVDVVEADASNFVMEDLTSRYPEADISIMSIREMTNDAGDNYFEVKARVTEGAATPCPGRMHIYYNYPEQNFISQPSEVITMGCEVCTEGICTLAFPEEAVIASHTFEGTDDISSYLSLYPSAYPSTTESKDSWLVVWNSPLALNTYYVELGKDGSVHSVDSREKGGQ
ncbi:MAG: hypothetical protein ABII71_02325 [Candidatus Micrarchaeota archaeon]